MRALLLVLFAAVSAPAFPGQCPFIRPPGLSPQQVDSVVLGAYAQALRVAPDSLTLSKTLKVLDGTENAILTYSFATLAVGETLGFDAVRTFFDAAKAKGAAQPFDSLPMSEILALARTEYAKGVDSEPPVAVPDMEFKVHDVIVRPPEPAEGWSLMRCAAEQVAFRRQSGASMSTAAVRAAVLPKYTSSKDFLAQVKSMLTLAVPPGFEVGSWQPTSFAASVPCADARFTASSSVRTLFFRARICYASPEANFGYAWLYSVNGNVGMEAPSAEAEEFVTRGGLR